MGDDINKVITSQDKSPSTTDELDFGDEKGGRKEKLTLDENGESEFFSGEGYVTKKKTKQ